VNRPNDLIQVDYMYFFRYITGAPLIDGDEDMTDAQRKKLESKLSKKLDTECSFRHLWSAAARRHRAASPSWPVSHAGSLHIGAVKLDMQ
jgi:hypothetical protein